MAFIVAPALSDGVPGFLFDERAGLRCFYDEGVGTWVIVDGDHPTPVVTVGGEELGLQAYRYNGERVWGGSYYVFCSVTDGWIASRVGVREPAAEKDVDGTTWIGDAWWKIPYEPCADVPTQTAEPKGTLLNEDEAEEAPEILWTWPRWEWKKEGSSRAPWGTFPGKGGAEQITKRRILGSERYRDNTRKYWVLALDKNSLSCTDGRTIRHVEDDDLWVLGTRGVGSWWQSDAGPDRSSGMTLAPWKHDEETGEDVEDPDGDPVELSFVSFVATQGKDRMYVAEVALWR